MNCPRCNHNKNTVLDTRKDKDNIYRKRKCKKCEHIWFTTESESADAKYNLQRAQYDTYKRKANDLTAGVKIKLPSILFKFNCAIKVYDSDNIVSEFEAFDVESLLKGVNHFLNDTYFDISSITVCFYHRESVKEDWKLLKCNHIFVIDETTLDFVRGWVCNDCNAG